MYYWEIFIVWCLNSLSCVCNINAYEFYFPDQIRIYHMEYDPVTEAKLLLEVIWIGDFTGQTVDTSTGLFSGSTYLARVDPDDDTHWMAAEQHDSKVLFDKKPTLVDGSARLYSWKADTSIMFIGLYMWCWVVRN